MKRFLKFFAIVLGLIISSAVLVACGGAPELKASDVAGTYKVASAKFTAAGGSAAITCTYDEYAAIALKEAGARSEAEIEKYHTFGGQFNIFEARANGKIYNLNAYDADDDYDEENYVIATWGVSDNKFTFDFVEDINMFDDFSAKYENNKIILNGVINDNGTYVFTLEKFNGHVYRMSELVGKYVVTYAKWTSGDGTQTLECDREEWAVIADADAREGEELAKYNVFVSNVFEIYNADAFGLFKMVETNGSLTDWGSFRIHFNKLYCDSGYFNDLTATYNNGKIYITNNLGERGTYVLTLEKDNTAAMLIDEVVGDYEVLNATWTSTSGDTTYTCTKEEWEVIANKEEAARDEDETILYGVFNGYIGGYEVNQLGGIYSYILSRVVGDWEITEYTTLSCQVDGDDTTATLTIEGEQVTLTITDNRGTMTLVMAPSEAVE